MPKGATEWVILGDDAGRMFVGDDVDLVIPTKMGQDNIKKAN